MADSSDVIKQMQQRIVVFNNDREWSQFHTPKDLALSLVLEAAEVLEHFQWKNEAEMRDHLKKKKMMWARNCAIHCTGFF